MMNISRSITKTIDINTSPEKAYVFMSNPLNWPQYAIVNLRSVNEGEDGWFKAVTKFGMGEIKVNSIKELGIVDHIWRDPQATWKVHARVIANNDGATVMMTFLQPSIMNNQQFDHAMTDLDIELAKLKEILE